uniref:Uncharacterized protein n=1 Tax=Arundo donax TaxID=35708 RepID=A0A0A8YJF5_ARUDO
MAPPRTTERTGRVSEETREAEAEDDAAISRLLRQLLLVYRRRRAVADRGRFSRLRCLRSCLCVSSSRFWAQVPCQPIPSHSLLG